MIKITRNGNDIDAMQAELNELLVEFSKTNDPETEKKLIKLYEKMTGFKKGCGVCIAGRALFMKSLGQMKDGEVLESLTSMKASMKSVQVKWHILKQKFLG